jgi:predicted metal-binding membrane protein
VARVARAGWVNAAFVGVIAALAWGLLLRAPHVHQITFASGLVLWSVMTAAMMLPAAVPWVTAMGTVRPEHPRRDLALFLVGQGGVWLGFCVLAASAQRALGAWVIDQGALPSLAAGLAVAGAGAYQLTPLKSACLRHCRSPLSYVLSRWDVAWSWALRAGVVHGATCLGCCWALMGLQLLTGVTHGASMVALTVVVVAEQTTPWGAWVARAVGSALLLVGATIVWRGWTG